MALFPGTNFNYFGSQQNTDDADEWNNVPQDSTISFDPSSLDKSAGNFGGQYGDVALDPGQFARAFAQKISQGYGAVDRALGGVLPGGADSPYIGASTTASGRKATGDILGTVGGYIGLEQAHAVAHDILKVLKQKQATNIPLNKLDEVRQNVSNTLGRNVQAFIMPDIDPHFNPGTNTIGLNAEAPNQQNIYLLGTALNDANKSNIFVNSPTALHELGHALNTGDPFANRLQQSRFIKFDPETGHSYPAFIAGIGAGTSDKEGNKGLLMSGVQGAIESMLAPGARHELLEEALASKNAVNLADKFGLPRGIPQLGAAWTTYGTGNALPGFAAGVASELATRGTRALGNAITDNIIDPIGDYMRGSDYNPLEQQLRKYGYNEKDYRLAQPGFGAPAQLQHK